MPRAKTPRATKPVITMPDPKPVAVERKAFPGTQPFDLETQIRERAYELYEERGRTPGQENEDWIRAEQEVMARQTQQARA